MPPIYYSEKRRKREELMCAAATPVQHIIAFEGTEIHVTDK
jgi:hypothetical protein